MRPARPSGVLAALVLATAFLAAGCASDSSAPSSSASSASSASSTSSSDRPRGTTSSASAAVVDGPSNYLLGPRAARQLGYRIDWQMAGQGRPLQRVRVEDDSVFVLRRGNMLVRIRRDEGDRVWSIPVASPIDEVLGINYVPDLERVYLATGGAILELDSGTGSQVGRQKLERIVNTQPVRLGQFLVYGSRDGMIVYHAFRLDTDWRKYQVGPSIQVEPQYRNGYLIAVASDGTVMNLLADNVSRVWTHRTLEPVVAPPAIGDNVAVVSSLDQHVRGYRLDENRTPIWQFLTESPLTNGPTLIGDVVYQQVPGRGLVCLEADPADAPGGRVVWWADTTGRVITRLGDDLVCWDDEARTLDLVEARLGAVIDRVGLPDVDRIMASGLHSGELYASGTDGRLLRLVPRP